MSTRKDRSNDELKQDLKGVQDRSRAKAAIPTKERDARATRSAQVKTAMAGFSIEKAVQGVTTASLGIQNSLGEVNKELMLRLAELDTVNQHINDLRQEIEELHGKDVVASSTEVLLAQHEEAKKQLQAEISELHLSWEAEQKKHAQEVAERIAETEKARKRDEDAYRYQFEQQRLADSNAWQDQKRSRAISEQDRQASLEKEWAVREESLRAKETEFSDLKARVEKFSEELKAEVARQTSIVGNALKKDHQHEVEILRKDAEAEKKLLTAQVANEQAESQRLRAQVADLTTKLAEANAKVTEIATKALESASGQRTLAEIQSFQGTRQDPNSGAKSRS